MGTNPKHRTSPSAFRGKPSSKEVALFVRMYADLLKGQFPYDEALAVVRDTVKHPSLRWAVGEILRDLTKGKRPKEAFGRHTSLLGEFTTRMLIVGFSSGNMAAMSDSLARFLERDIEIRRHLRRLVMQPIITVLVLYGALRFMSSAALSLSAGSLIRSLLSPLLHVLPLLAIVVVVLRHKEMRTLLDRWVIRLPIVGSMIHKMSIERFARALHTLYTDSSDNIRILRMAASVSGNRYMERRIVRVTIPMLKRGKDLMASLESSEAFTKGALVMLRSGHASGTLRKAALRLANHCANSISYEMKMLATGADVLLAVAVAAMIIPLILAVAGQIKGLSAMFTP